MNVFRFELKRNVRAAIVWMMAISLLLVFFMPFTKAFVDQSDAFLELFDGFDDVVLNMLNIDKDLFFSEVGFLSYILNYVALAVASYALSTALGILGGEKRAHASDFLLTKPVSRKKLFVAKLSAIVVLQIALFVAFFAVTVTAVLLVSDGQADMKSLVLMLLGILFLQLFFAGVGMLLAVLLSKIKSVVSISVGVALPLFFFGMIMAMVESKALRFFAPFRYVDNNYVLTHSSFEGVFLIVMFVVPVLCAISAFVMYTRANAKQ